MEDAKISNTNEKVNEKENKEEPFISFKERYPYVITSDDLIWELGKNCVDKINKEKLLEKLLEKNNNITNQLQLMTTEHVKMLKQNEVLNNSVNSYVKNNNKFSSEIESLRKELLASKHINTELKTSNEKYDLENSELKKEIESLNEKYDLENSELKKEIESLNEKFIKSKSKSKKKEKKKTPKSKENNINIIGE